MTAVNYLWDPVEQNIVRELDDSGNVIAQYTTEPGLYGDLLSQRRNGEDSYYHYDGQGSTVALTNSVGDVTDTYEYSAFGEVTERTGSTVNAFQYIGRNGYYRDSETAEYEVRRRPLHIQLGRWTTTDPLEFIDGPNLYCYVMNRATMHTDPSGLEFPCKDDEIAVPKKGFVPETNGCTGVPDCPPGGADFFEVCNGHDRCYQTCKKTKRDCDDTWFAAMRAQCLAVRDLFGSMSPEEYQHLCNQGYPADVLLPVGQCANYTYEQCLSAADFYYLGVTRLFRARSQAAYEQSQKEACDCQKK